MEAELKNKEAVEAFRFVLIGLLNTIVGYGIYAGLLYFSKLHYITASALSNFIAVTQAFFWYKYWIFKSKGPFLKEFLKFASLYLMTFFIGLAIVALFVEVFHFNPYISGIISLVFCAAISFLGNKFWSFRRREQEV